MARKFFEKRKCLSESLIHNKGIKLAIERGLDYIGIADHSLYFYREKDQLHLFDYVIGSVHHVSGKNIFERGRWDGLNGQEKVAEKECYYKLIQQSAKSGIFQI